jgi:hypothetical protein
MAESRAIKSARVVFNPKEQKLEAIQRVMGSILGRASCSMCGRVAVLDIQFAGDPEPGLGVISVTTVG